MKHKKPKQDIAFLRNEQQQRLYALLKDDDKETCKSINEILETYMLCRLAEDVGLTAINGDEVFEVKQI